jgi:hypothetical protein
MGKKMFDALIILLSAIVLVSLIIIKLPLTMWHRRIRMRIWHQFMIWKIERKMQKSSNTRENPLQVHQQSEKDISPFSTQ